MSFWSKLLGRSQEPPDNQEPEETWEQSQLRELDERLRKLQTRERRQAQLLERMHLEMNTKLDALQTQLRSDIPLDTITACAESLALYRQNREQDPDLEHVWNKFTEMLEAFGLSLILDHGQEFNDTRHQVCDTRWDPDLPANTVLEVVRPGLILNNQVSRPAVVIINSPRSQEESAANPNTQTTEIPEQR